MRWKTGRRSSNVEDRRGGGSRGMPVKAGGIGIIVIALIGLFFGVDLSPFLSSNLSVNNNAPYSSDVSTRPAEENQLADFVSVVLGDTEDAWNHIFPQLGRRYVEPRLVLFTGAVQSACGYTQAAVGPFYCPVDQKVYIDLSFYRDLRERFRAPGDFAQAYVIAHEVGHHVQTLLGISQKVHNLRERVSEAEGNRLSVRQELQADCFAGVWAHHAQRARQILEQGDIEEALNAASSIGDDRIQMQSRGYVSPESFTHGTSEQRVRWFKQGFLTGDCNECDTFKSDRL